MDCNFQSQLVLIVGVNFRPLVLLYFKGCLVSSTFLSDAPFSHKLKNVVESKAGKGSKESLPQYTTSQTAPHNYAWKNKKKIILSLVGSWDEAKACIKILI